MASRPHISAALRQLRVGVACASAALVAACLLQLVVFGCVHFTDMRFAQLEPAVTHQPTIVKAGSDEGSSGLRDLFQAPPPPSEEAPDLAGPPAEPIDPNRVQSAAGVVLERASEAAIVLGVFASVALCLHVVLGAVVAGGAAVPGVERVVSASTWSLVIVMLALPWHDVYPSMAFAGVFASYGDMVALGGQETSLLAVLLVFVGLPVVALLGAMVVGFKFASGVERGIVSPHAPDAVDVAMAEDVRNVGSTHQVGAVRDEFRSTFGSVPSAPPAAASRAGSNQPATDPQHDGSSARPAPRRRASLNPTEQADWRRPV